MAQRIKGQEVQISVIVNNVIQASITDIKNFEVTPKLEMLEEQYLGQTTDQYDEIYKGVKGSMEINFDSQDVFKLIQSVIDRAQRRTPGTVINIKATLQFPNGDRPRVSINNAFFGDFPVKFGSRSDYGTIGIDFQSSTVQVLTT